MPSLSLFFFNDTATTEIYTLSLHDALPILARRGRPGAWGDLRHPAPRRAGSARIRHRSRIQPDRESHEPAAAGDDPLVGADRKSTRLNSSHGYISYAVFCLKKKKKKKKKK